MAISPALRHELARELEHWDAATERLADLDGVAPPQAWHALEHYLGVALRQAITTVIARLKGKVAHAKAELAATSLGAEAQQARLADLRQAYQRSEMTVDFFADALQTRSTPRIAALLRACDHIATRSMAEALTPMGREVPAALTYIDKGMGASIIKSGLRLWDGTIDNPVATIKVTRHHLLRPSQVLHESGHQVSHMLAWHPEMAQVFSRRLGGEVGRAWASWASEVAADAFAHVHAGFASASALHDVVDGSQDAVFQFLPGDPHPVSYVRVRLALEMCRRSFGPGPWDATVEAWTAKHPIARCPPDIRPLLEASVAAMPEIVELVLHTPYRAFNGRPLTRLIDPRRVSPAALARLEREAGDAIFTSPYWAWNEAIRLLALNGYRAALGARDLRQAVRQQEEWMLRLGSLKSAA